MSDHDEIEAWRSAAAYCTPADVVGSAVTIMERLTLDTTVLRETLNAAVANMRRLRAAVKDLRVWAEDRVVGRSHPYCGESAPDSDVVFMAVVKKIDKLLAEHGGEVEDGD